MAYVLTMVKPSPAAETSDIAAIAKELGLPIQEQRYRALHVIDRDLKPLTEDQHFVWRAFCPTAYRNDEFWADGKHHYLSLSGNGYDEARRRLMDYRHDTIPAEVLRHWSSVKSKYAFDTYEIRTTERTPTAQEDPILLGYFSDKAYLLARWGLESPGSLPITEVACRVKKEREQTLRTERTFLFSNRKEINHRAHDCPIWQAATRVLAT